MLVLGKEMKIKDKLKNGLKEQLNFYGLSG